MFKQIYSLLHKFFKNFNKNGREPPKNIMFEEISSRHSFKGLFASVAIHLIGLFLFITFFREIPIKIFEDYESIKITNEVVFVPSRMLDKIKGGGGGNRSPLPGSKGSMPKEQLKQFVPPQAEIINPNPIITLQPSLVLPPDIDISDIKPLRWGLPSSNIEFPSSGPGSGGGIGTGKGGGIGPGIGPGSGPGIGGGIGSKVYLPGGGVTAPTLLYKIDPEYTEKARRAKIQGTVLLYAEINKKGKAQNIEIIRGLGLGLDEKSIEAVKKWRFKPGMKDGKPVIVAVTIEINFVLL